MKNKTYLIVPYKQKEKVKSLGAQWDSSRKMWFIANNQNKNKFTKWVPKTESECNLQAVAPIYLVESKQSCWRCKKETEVITIASSGVKEINGEETFNDFIIFSDIEYLPRKLINFLQKRYSNYFLDYSQTAETVYYLNHCDWMSPCL